ncbi:Echinoderm microtubule-associated protein-like 5, partial [Branchiostoma belcheri]
APRQGHHQDGKDGPCIIHVFRNGDSLTPATFRRNTSASQSRGTAAAGYITPNNFVFRNGDSLTPATLVVFRRGQPPQQVFALLRAKMKFDVKSLYVLTGRRVGDLSRLKHGGYYVAAGPERFKKVEYRVEEDAFTPRKRNGVLPPLKKEAPEQVTTTKWRSASRKAFIATSMACTAGSAHKVTMATVTMVTSMAGPVGSATKVTMATARKPEALSEATDRSVPPARLRLEWVYGYRGYKCRNNVHYNAAGEVVYFTAAVGIVYNPDKHTQKFFMGHNDDIIRTRHWKAESIPLLPLPFTSTTEGMHALGARILAFDFTGERLVSVGVGQQPEVVVWNWNKGQVLAKDVAVDRVFDVKFNPWKPEQLVTCGVDHLQFWTVSTEGGMTSAEEGDFTDNSRKASLLSVAFGSGDVVYSGTEKGDVYVWRDGKLSAQEIVQNAHESKVVFVEAQLTADPRGPARVRGFSTVSSDGTINLYDEKFSQTNTVKLGEGDRDLSVCSLAFSPTTQTVLVGTTTNELLEVDISEPEAPRTVHELVQGHGPGELRALAVHPSEPSFLTAGEDHTPEAPRTVHELVQGHGPGELRALAVHPSEPSFLTAGEDHTVSVTSTLGQRYLADNTGPRRGLVIVFSGISEPEAPRTVHELVQGHGPGELRALAVHPSEPSFLTAGEDHTPEAPRTVHELVQGHGPGELRALAVHPSEPSFLTAGEDHTPEAPRTVHELVQGHGPGELRALAVHPSEPSFLTAGEDHTVRIWSMKDRAPVLRREVHDGTVMAAAYSPDGSHIALGMKDGKIEILYKRHVQEDVTSDTLGQAICDLKDMSQKTVHVTSDTLGQAICDLKDMPQKTVHVISDTFGQAVCDLKDMSQKTVHVTSDTLGQAICDLKYSPDGRYLAAASHDGRVAVFDPTANYDSVRQFPAGSYPVMHIDWSTDSRFLQTNDEQGERAVYKMPEGKMATKRDDLTAIVWDTWTGVLGDEVQGIWAKYSDLSDVNTADVNFDHGVMVTGDDQGLVKLFRFPCIRKGAKFRKYGGHADHVTNVRFSCEGSRVVSIGGADSSVFQWKLLPHIQGYGNGEDISVTGADSSVFQWKLLPHIQGYGNGEDISVTGALSLRYRCVINALQVRYTYVVSIGGADSSVFQWKLLPHIQGYGNGEDISVTGALSLRYRCVINALQVRYTYVVSIGGADSSVFQWKLLPHIQGYGNGEDLSVTGALPWKLLPHIQGYGNGEDVSVTGADSTVFQWKLLPHIQGYGDGEDVSVTGADSTVFQWKLLPHIQGYGNETDLSVTGALLTRYGCVINALPVRYTCVVSIGGADSTVFQWKLLPHIQGYGDETDLSVTVETTAAHTGVRQRGGRQRYRCVINALRVRYQCVITVFQWKLLPHIQGYGDGEDVGVTVETTAAHTGVRGRGGRRRYRCVINALPVRYQCVITVFQWKLLPHIQGYGDGEDVGVTVETTAAHPGVRQRGGRRRYRCVITVFQWKLLPHIQGYGDGVDLSVTGLRQRGGPQRYRCVIIALPVRYHGLPVETTAAHTGVRQRRGPQRYRCVINALRVSYHCVITVFQWKLLPHIQGYGNGEDLSVTGELLTRYRCVITVFQWKLLPHIQGYGDGEDVGVTVRYTGFTAWSSSGNYCRIYRGTAKGRTSALQWKLLPHIQGYGNDTDIRVTGALLTRYRCVTGADSSVFQWKLLPHIQGYGNGEDLSVTDYVSSDEEDADSDVSDADLDSDVEQEAEVTYDRHVSKDDVKKRKKSFKYMTSGVDRNKPPFESLQLKFVHGRMLYRLTGMYATVFHAFPSGTTLDCRNNLHYTRNGEVVYRAMVVYRAQDCRNNLHYTRNGEVVYHVAAVGIVYERDSHSQRFYLQHTDDILCLAKHPTDDIFATGQVGKDPTIHVWESENMDSLAVLQGQHARGVCELDFTAAGTRLASVGLDDDHSIVIWDWKTATPLAKTRGHKDKIFGVQWNPYDSARFVTIGIKHIKFWTMSGNSFTSKRGIFGSAGEINSMVSVAHGGTPEDVFTGAPSGQVYVWRGNNLARTVQAHSGPCFSVKVDGHDILTAGKDGVVCVWTEGFSKCVKRYTINRHFLQNPRAALLEDKPPVRTVCAGEGTVLVGTKNGEVLELDRATGKFGILAQGHMGKHLENELWGLAAHPSKHVVATVSDDRTLRLWDVAENVMLAARRLDTGGRCADFSPDGRMLAVGLNNGSFFVLNPETWEIKTKFHHRKEKISDIRFSPDGKYLAVASHENHVDVYNMEKGKRVGICKGASSYITHIDWEGTGRVLQVNSGARERLFFEIPRCKHLPMREPDKTLQWYTWTSVLGPLSSGVWPAGCDVTDVNAVSASHDWSLLAAADDFGFVKLFRFPCDGDYAKFKKYLGHSSHVTNVRWSHDDTRLVTSGGMDTSLMVWVRRRSAPRDGGSCDSDDSDTDMEDGEESRALFAMADVDSDGTVTSSELAKALRKLGYRPTEADIRDILAAADDEETEGTNGDSGVDPGESDSLDFERFHRALTTYRDRWER